MKTIEIVVPDIIVVGLSIAQVSNSGYYREAIERLFKLSGKSVQVFILPQGAAAKLAVDKYGATFPERTKDFNASINYVLCDIGLTH